MSRLMLCLSVLAASVQPALAGEQGEIVRLRGSLQARVEKAQWTGAERLFRQLEQEVAEDPSQLSAADWRLGATIARTLGDMAGVQRRLQSAFDLEPDDALRTELQQIAAQYGPLKIEVAPGFSEDLSLVATPAPFEPDKRAFIAAATERLQQERVFEGLVPTGSYTLAGRTLEVTTGAIDTLRVRIGPDGDVTLDRMRAGAGSEAPGLEPHMSLGVGFAALTEAPSGIQPNAFAGASLRLSAGVDAWLGARAGVRVELGYLSALGAGQVHQGTLWLGGTWRAGPLDLAVGPMLGVGSGRATGLDGDAWAELCADRPEDATCRGLALARDEDLAEATLRGRVLTLGGTAGATWELVRDGSVRPAVGLFGGAQSDGQRVYPWAQAGLTLRL